MSSGFEDSEFEAFRAQPSRAEIDEHLSQVQERIKAFLEARGVVFEIAQNVSDEEKIVALSARRDLQVITTYSAYFEAVRELKGEDVLPSPDFKKRLQATFITLGYDQPWLDAIDNEIPGDPLTEDDVEIRMEAAIKAIQDEEVAERLLNEKISQMVEYLEANGIEIGKDDEIVMSQLAIFSIANFKNQPLSRRLEDARAILFRNNLDHPAWLSLVQEIFG